MWSTLIALLTLAAISHAALAQDRTLTFDDYGTPSWPYSPSISADGDRVAYVLDERVYLLAVDGKEEKPITPADLSAWDNRWSSDGDSILYLGDSGEGTQIYRQALRDASVPVQLSHFTQGVYGINLSPDESRVLLDVTDNDLREVDEDAEPQPIIIKNRNYKTDRGNGYVSAGDTHHVYVYDIGSQAMRRITSGSQEESDAAWSPDGESIVFVSEPPDGADDSYQTDLWVVEVDDSNQEASPRQLTDSVRTKSSPAYSPDGTQIAYLSAVNGAFSVVHIVVIPADGGEPRVLTEQFDRWVIEFEFSHDGEWIYFSYYNAGAVSLARVRARDSEIEILLDAEMTVSSFDVCKTGEIVFNAYDKNEAGDVFSLKNGRLEQLTEVNKDFFTNVKLAERSKVTFEYSGVSIDTFITTPPNYVRGKAYPTILRLHGGPHSQFAWGFDFTNQYFASLGYVIVEPNPRGSIGKGQAFIDPMHKAWGYADADDVMAAVDYAISKGLVDVENLFVTGYSYGGLLTNALITRTDRFNAAASGAGHSLMEANFGHDMHEAWYLWELGTPWENRELYDKNSPLRRVESVVTPTLFLAGQLDINVPVLNSELFYQALKVLGIDAKLVIYPGMHHGGWTDAFEKDYLIQITEWFEQYKSK